MSNHLKYEVCSNWWPLLEKTTLEKDSKMPHTLCQFCANWLPEIEELGNTIQISSISKHSGCQNDWPAKKNKK